METNTPVAVHIIASVYFLHFMRYSKSVSLLVAKDGMLIEYCTSGKTSDIIICSDKVHIQKSPYIMRTSGYIIREYFE